MSLKKRQRVKEAECATSCPEPVSEDVSQVSANTSEGMIAQPQFAQQKGALVNTNKQRCLLLGTRLVSARERALLRDFRDLIPHSVLTSRVTVPYSIATLMKELVALHSCNTSVVIRAKKKQTILWISQGKQGPSVSFALANIFPASGQKFNGNCLKYSRPVLHFDQDFQNLPHLRAIRTMLTMVFGTPKNHPKSKPFIDHMFCFFYYDGIIWFRNYQIPTKSADDTELLEIGPRFALSPITLLDGLFQGDCIWKNARPASTASIADGQSAKASQYIARKEAKLRKNNREKFFPSQQTKEDLLMS
ncbi:ribosome biogenesis protein [Perkinsela sp. CCAP 1560/4]|nr:ribosome biogenesis protein [Perkinsela sp. CCAP 1560/4]|eukprot:KNH08998.1 ribosome biogenesis protein [Perkinsela sp. CCAP 1560/4]